MDRFWVTVGETNTPARQLYEFIGFGVVNWQLDYVKPVEEWTGRGSSPNICLSRDRTLLARSIFPSGRRTPNGHATRKRNL
jgi:hypothetical protein